MKRLIDIYRKKINRERKFIFGLCAAIIFIVWTGLYNQFNPSITTGTMLILLVAAFIRSRKQLSDDQITKRIRRLLKYEDVELFSKTIDSEMKNELCISNFDNISNSWFFLTKTWVICISNHNSIIRKRSEIVSYSTRADHDSSGTRLVIVFANAEVFGCNFYEKGEKIVKELSTHVEQGI